MEPVFDPNTPAPAPAPVATPAPVVTPEPLPPAPAPVVLPPAPTFSEGGGVGKSGISGFFQDIRVGDVAMFALAATAAGMIIFYCRSRIAHLRTEKSKDRKDIEELKTNVQAALGESYKPLY